MKLMGIQQRGQTPRANAYEYTTTRPECYRLGVQKRASQTLSYGLLLHNNMVASVMHTKHALSAIMG